MFLLQNDIGLTSVRYRGLLVPHRAILEVLARCIRPLLFENDDAVYHYSKRGSSTLLAFGEEYFVVFAEHQRADYVPDRIRIVRGFSGGPSLAIDTFVTVNAVGEEIEDVRALRISREHHSRRDLFDFAPVPERLPPVQAAKMLIAFGTPTAKSEISDDPGHVHVGTVPVPCTYDRPSINATGLHHAKITASRGPFLPLDLDGMSGGAVFSIDGQPGQYVANYRGMILRGSNGYLHYIDAALIRRIFEKFGGS